MLHAEAEALERGRTSPQRLQSKTKRVYKKQRKTGTVKPVYCVETLFTQITGINSDETMQIL